MTKVEFIKLKKPEKALHLCELAEEFFAGGRRVLIIVTDDNQAVTLDRFMWTWQKGSFIPHACDNGAVDCFEESVVIGTAMVCTALLFVVYPLVQAAWAMGVLSVLLGLALGSVQPMIMSTLHQITPQHRHGEALGLRAMAINGSSVVMPLLFGSAGVVVGVAGVFWVVGAVVGLGSRLAWTLRSDASGHASH